MIDLRISLFGKLNVLSGDHLMTGMDQRQDRELFCYLLLYRDRPHPRETLAETLFFLFNFTLGGDYDVLTHVLWSQEDRTQELANIEKNAKPHIYTNEVLNGGLGVLGADKLKLDGNYQIRLQAIGADADRNVRLSEATSWFQVANRVPAQTAK